MEDGICKTQTKTGLNPESIKNSYKPTRTTTSPDILTDKWRQQQQQQQQQPWTGTSSKKLSKWSIARWKSAQVTREMYYNLRAVW